MLSTAADDVDGWKSSSNNASDGEDVKDLVKDLQEVVESCCGPVGRHGEES